MPMSLEVIGLKELSEGAKIIVRTGDEALYEVVAEGERYPFPQGWLTGFRVTRFSEQPITTDDLILPSGSLSELQERLRQPYVDQESILPEVIRVGQTVDIYPVLALEFPAFRSDTVTFIGQETE